MSRVSAQTHEAIDVSPQTIETKAINRREFFYYLFGASVALLTAESCAGSLWFALPHLSYGVDLFKIPLSTIPVVNAAPIGVPKGKFWLSNTPSGLLALDMQCVQDMFLYKWVPTNNRFECPLCGSKFRTDGTFIKHNGPASRDLDRFIVRVTTPMGFRQTSPDGEPVRIEGATEIVVNTYHKISGKPV